MWNFLKFNLLSMGGSILVLLSLFLLLFLTSKPKEEPNTILLFLLNTVGLVAILTLFFSIVGTIADCWKVFIKGEEVEGFQWKHTSKSAPLSPPTIRRKQTWQDLAKENLAKKSSSQITEPLPTHQKQSVPNDPLGIR
ncbi:MAG: hypothetical protein LUM44_11210 [Pyrinomonadaceae bacterium]|nr:hypothetical protein [Pyrinomonadaceae bacterium]